MCKENLYAKMEKLEAQICPATICMPKYTVQYILSSKVFKIYEPHLRTYLKKVIKQKIQPKTKELEGLKQRQKNKRPHFGHHEYEIYLKI